MLADLYDCKVQTVASKEGPALGVAILAGVGVGLYPSVQEACDQMMQTNKTAEPIAEHTQSYQGFYQLNTKRYQSLKDDYKTLATL